VDDLKTEDSVRTMPLADGVVAVLTQWKQVSQFARPDDWIFASPWKLGRQPVCYSWIGKTCPLLAKSLASGISVPTRSAKAYRTWLDALETPVGVQQKMMRHTDIRTTMNHHGTALKAYMRKASDAVGRVSAGFKAS
jgi:integrase